MWDSADFRISIGGPCIFTETWFLRSAERDNPPYRLFTLRRRRYQYGLCHKGLKRANKKAQMTHRKFQIRPGDQ